MKILVATPLYPPQMGGPATYVKMLEEQLPKYDFELEVVPFSVVSKWPKVIKHFVYFWRLYKLAKEADVVFSLDSVSVGLPASIAAKLTKTTFLLRVPGDYAWEQGQIRFGVKDTLDEFVEDRSKYNIFVRLLHKVQSSVAQYAETVIVPSEYMKEIVTTWGVHPARITPVYSALHPLSVGQDRIAIRKELGYNGVVIVSVGRLVPWKGFMALIELLPKLKERLKSANLVIVGEGPDGARLRARAQELGLSESVRFLGRLDKAELAKALVGADVFALNTAYEGLSHQLLEVMDIGLPIVTTNVGGNPELLKDTVSGILVKYNDQEELLWGLQRASNHDSYRDSLVANARLRVKDFAEEKVVSELLSVLNTLA